MAEQRADGSLLQPAWAGAKGEPRPMTDMMLGSLRGPDYRMTRVHDDSGVVWVHDEYLKRIYQEGDPILGNWAIDVPAGLAWVRKLGRKIVHPLKTWPEYFEAMASGAKTFEVRYNDRYFEVGDLLLLQEYDPNTHDYTGRSLTVAVTYILPGGITPSGPDLGLYSGYVVMAVSKQESSDDPQGTQTNRQ